MCSGGTYSSLVGSKVLRASALAEEEVGPGPRVCASRLAGDRGEAQCDSERQPLEATTLSESKIEEI